jgi:hypothetical protein
MSAWDGGTNSPFGSNIIESGSWRFKVTEPYFAPGAVYGSTEQRGDDGFRWSINLTTGRLTPIVTGLGNPRIMAFISTGSHLNAPKLLIGKAPWVSVSEMERL